MVHHYVEEIGEPDHLRLVSKSDLFTPTGRTKIGVIWDLSVKKIDDKTCEFTNTVRSSATPELIDFLGLISRLIARVLGAYSIMLYRRYPYGCSAALMCCGRSWPP